MQRSRTISTWSVFELLSCSFWKHVSHNASTTVAMPSVTQERDHWREDCERSADLSFLIHDLKFVVESSSTFPERGGEGREGDKGRGGRGMREIRERRGGRAGDE